MRLRGLVALAVVAGPGIVVMLADTDVGSIITAGQSGAQWGYRLLLLQFLLIPVLFLVQELAVRLGIITGKGHGELIREYFGPRWAWLSVSALLVACAGALVTEFVGVQAVGRMLGVPSFASLGLAATFLLVVVATGSYRRVEMVALLLGAFELVFFVLALRARPDDHAVVSGLVHLPVGSGPYTYLVAANIGAVVMPWMVFYQQSAVIDKGLKAHHLRHARRDTAIGAVVTQVIMASVLITVAAATAAGGTPRSLRSVGDIAAIIAPITGTRQAELLLGLSVIGAAMVAAIVVSLAAAWGVGEVTGYRRSLDHRISDAPWFYGLFAAIVIAAAVTVDLVHNLVSLAIAVQVMNALLLPLVLGMLFVLARRALPAAHRLRGRHALMTGIVMLGVSLLGVYCGITGAAGMI